MYPEISLLILGIYHGKGSLVEKAELLFEAFDPYTTSNMNLL